MKNDNDWYETHDLPEAAYLSLVGAKYLGKRREGQRVWFCFQHCDISDMREKFYDGTGRVSAYDYAAKLAALKHMCFS